MLNTPFPPWPSYTDEEAQAVARVLLSNKVNYWTGTETRDFESEFAAWAGVPHAVALANGTVALDVALKALGIGAGDEVIVTPRSFMASVSCVVTAGAIPVFADVDRDTQNLSAATIAPHITSRTKAIIPVHLAGMPCDMDPIMELAKAHGLAVIEDCAQANGARYRGQHVGTIGTIGAWSFCQDKILTTGGEGGMVTTRDRDLWSRMWSYKDHGKSYDAVYERQHPPGFRWLHESFGMNGRMLELQSVLGRIQLRRLPAMTATRQRYANQIWSAARAMPGLRVPCMPSWAEHAAYRCYVFVEHEALKADWDRDRIMNTMNSEQIPCYSGSCSEIYLEKAFDGTGWRPEAPLPVAKELGETSLMFLVHPTLEDAHIERTCATLKDVMRRAVR
ncbi:MAG: DegT/DnrJ/EryC1/StrS aminotransferase family protein [bacterium]